MNEPVSANLRTSIRETSVAPNLAQELIISPLSVALRQSLALQHNYLEYPESKFPIEAKKIDSKFVHKSHSVNVVIADPIRLDQNLHIYRTRLVIPYDNTFFFDHTYDHVPGILLIEAMRQMGTAVSHRFLNCSFEDHFVLHNANTNFNKFAALNDDPIYIDLSFKILKEKDNKPRKLSGHAFVHSNGELLCDMSSEWTILSTKLMKKLFS